MRYLEKIKLSFSPGGLSLEDSLRAAKVWSEPCQLFLSRDCVVLSRLEPGGRNCWLTQQHELQVLPLFTGGFIVVCSLPGSAQPSWKTNKLNIKENEEHEELQYFLLPLHCLYCRCLDATGSLYCIVVNQSQYHVELQTYRFLNNI